jgi:hypothetical protein
MGQMIGVPFILWLIYNNSHFGGITQPLAIFGLSSQVSQGC